MKINEDYMIKTVRMVDILSCISSEIALIERLLAKTGLNMKMHDWRCATMAKDLKLSEEPFVIEVIDTTDAIYFLMEHYALNKESYFQLFKHKDPEFFIKLLDVFCALGISKVDEAGCYRSIDPIPDNLTLDDLIDGFDSDLNVLKESRCKLTHIANVGRY